MVCSWLIIITKFLFYTLTEASFRQELVALEKEVVELKRAACEHKQQIKAKEKIVKENQELKSTICSQDEQVIILWCYNNLFPV